MGIWTEMVERKASIIHAQMSAAREIALANGGSPEQISEPYLKLLRALYADEFPFAQLTDSSDLVARFSGPAVDVRDPAVSIVISVFSDIRGQIRSIAKSVAGLSSESQIRWPAHLDPHLAGIARGSLIVGVSVVPPEFNKPGSQLEFAGVSEHIFASVLSAIRGLSSVARHIGENEISQSLNEEFPDPAVRDTVLVAARRLSPTGRRGIDSVSFFSPKTKEENPVELTQRSRQVIAGALNAPVHRHTEGSFEGVLREVDLDAKRFEIRGVSGVGSIRCAYAERHEADVRKSLDARVKISGRFEALPSGRPRMVAVESVERIGASPSQLQISDET
ncbi:MAG: hypothetical protein ACOY9J_03625 [Pseudomonadota bacterium]